MIWLVANNLLQANYKLAVLAVLLYLAGFLSAVLLFGLTDVRIERSFLRTPTPAASSTTMGTDPLPATEAIGRVMSLATTGTNHNFSNTAS
jgi:hypothetical protein